MIATLVLAAATVLPQQFTALPLAQALQQAVQTSADVAAARERVRENQASLAAARGAAAPGIDLNYAAVPQGGNANNTVEQTLTTIGGDMTLGDVFAYAPAVREAQFTLQSAQYDLLDAQRTEREKTIGLYYDALAAAATLRVREEDLSGAQSDLHAAQLRFRAGDAPRLDVVRAQVAVATARSAVEAARVDLDNARNALSVETGTPLEQLYATAEATPSAVPADAGRAIARALAQRSDLASAQAAVGAEEAAVRAAQRNILPAVTVSAGYTRGYDSGIAVAGPSAAVNLRMPVSGASANRIAAERARLAQAQDKVVALQRAIHVAVGAAARTDAETLRAVASAQRAREAAQEELLATQVGYRNGASSSLDVADARRTFVQAQLAELNAVYAQARAAAILQEEMGP
jgi:outer membrane protein TolC